jgi:hypothetical protein
MTVKAFRSTLTWRTLDYQDQVLARAILAWPDVPVYTGEEDFLSVIKPTTRKGIVTVFMASLAVLAKEEKDFRARMSALMKRKFRIVAIEDNTEWSEKSKIKDATEAWKAARTFDAGKRGGYISAGKRKAASEIAAKAIKDRWKLSSNEWPTKVLLKEVDVSLNTAKRLLGNRPLAQANYRAVLKRKATSDAKYPRMKRADNYIDEAP